MRRTTDYSKEFDSILNSLSYIRQVDDNEEINKAYLDVYTTKQQQVRDKKITELLSLYVDGYRYKTKSNKVYKGILVAVCVIILFAFCICFISFVCKVDLKSETTNIEQAVQLISICATFLGLIIGLLQIITKYVFPEKEEEYITRIVELIQNNDLENKKENIKVQGTYVDGEK